MIIWQQRQDDFLFSVLWGAIHDVKLRDSTHVWRIFNARYSCRYLSCKRCVHVSWYLCSATYSLQKYIDVRGVCVWLPMQCYLVCRSRCVRGVFVSGYLCNATYSLQRQMCKRCVCVSGYLCSAAYSLHR